MVNLTRRRTASALGCAALAAASLVSLAGQSAAKADTAGATGVTAILAAPHLHALEALAANTRLSRAERLHRLSKLVPSVAEHDRVVRALRAEGLTVTDQTTWSVSASGSTASVAADFGTRPRLPAHATQAETRAATGALPELPDPLRAAGVASAYPTYGGPAAVHPASLNGTDYRNAYASPASTGTPSKGADRNGALTIATVQFSNWNSGDLTHYAASHDIALAKGQYTGITVGHGPGDSSGDEEVDLDQESLLSTAPTAHQRAYFAPNTNAGQAEAYSQVLDDVLQDRDAVDGGDPRIAALSASWGNCESDQGQASIKTLQPIFASLLAAGVTLFNSVGDDGIYDCGEVASNVNGKVVENPSTAARVDFPASSPYVIGVGASTLKPVGSSAPNNGTNWVETGWSCTSPEDCEGSKASDTGGSGGGVSASIAEPSWQSDYIGNSTYTSVGKRLVPDISTGGAPNTGFSIYTSDTDACGGVHTCVYGGSSLSTPVAAALFTNLLASYGRDAGIGNILPNLYDAFAATKGDAVGQQAFRDVTTGTNGAATNKGSDPSVLATTGYDTVSGLGGVIWPNLASYLISATATPTVSAHLALSHPDKRATSRTVTASWAVHETGRGAGPAGATIVIHKLGRSKPVYSEAVGGSGHLTFTGSPAASYQMTVVGKDVLGHTGTGTSNTLAVPRDDRLFHLHGAWTRVTNKHDYAGSRAVTASTSARAIAFGTGTTYLLDVQTGPTLGKLAVYLGNTKLTTIDEYSARTHHIRVKIFTGSSRLKRLFTLRATGTRNHAATGRDADVDALVVKG